MSASCVFFVIAVWLFCLVDSKIYTDCDKSIIRNDHCWRNHVEPPDCRHVDPLFACITNVVDQFPAHCPMKGKQEAQQKLGLSQFLYSVYCARRELYQEFQHKKNCWKNVRLCLQDLPISFEEVIYRYEQPSVEIRIDKYSSQSMKNEIVANECYRQGLAIQQCYSRDIGCHRLESFVDAVLSQSICANYRIEQCPTCAHNNTFMRPDRITDAASKDVYSVTLITSVIIAGYVLFFA